MSIFDDLLYLPAAVVVAAEPDDCQTSLNYLVLRSVRPIPNTSTQTFYMASLPQYLYRSQIQSR